MRRQRVRIGGFALAASAAWMCGCTAAASLWAGGSSGDSSSGSTTGSTAGSFSGSYSGTYTGAYSGGPLGPTPSSPSTSPCPLEANCGALADAGTPGPFQPQFAATVTAAAPPPPISGGTLLVLADGKTAIAADPDRDTIDVVDVSAGALTFAIPLQAGDEPGRLAEDGAGHVHVALRGAGAIATIDPASGTLLARQNVCPSPRGVAWDKANDFIWVACATGELVALPAAGGAAVRSFVVERDLRDVVVGADGSLSVSSFRAAQILRVAADGTVSRRDSLTPLIGFTPHVAWRTVAGSNGNLCVTHQQHSTSSLSTTSPGGYGLAPESGAVISMLTILGPDGTVLTSSGLEGVLPVDVALSPDGLTAAVAMAGDGLVGNLPDLVLVALDAPPDAGSLTNDGAVPGSIDAGGPAADGSIAGDGAPETFLVPPPPPNFGFAFQGNSVKLGTPGNTEVVALAFGASGQLLVLTRDSTLWIFDVVANAWKASVVLSTVSRDDTGHDIFHAAAGALVACASCHPEGQEDSHVWLLDGNMRRTPSLRGTVAGTAPYHWPGDEPDLTTLTNDVYSGRMSGARLATAQISALESWVESIPALPAPSWVDPAAAQRGQALFQSPTAACSTCHAGPKFTNNLTLDVGTGGAFQVPPLVGVGWRTPLMHDGCAATIADRFGACATPTHGGTASLTPANVSDLTAYLETL